MSFAPLQNDREQMDNVSSYASGLSISAAEKTPSSSPTSPAFLHNPSRPNSVSLTTAPTSRPTTQKVSANSMPSDDHEHSTLILKGLEPWMDKTYALQVAGLMGWSPVSVRIPTPPPVYPSSPTPSSDPRQRLLSDRLPAGAYQSSAPNNPGHLFLTFPTAALASSFLAQLEYANLNQSQAGRPPIPLPKSDRLMDLALASPADSAACWAYHVSNQRRESGNATRNSRYAGLGVIGSEDRAGFGKGGEVAPTSGGTKGSASPHSSTSSLEVAIRGRRKEGKADRLASNPQSSISFRHAANSPSHVSSSTHPGAQQPRAQEYSVWIGDVADDVTPSDLVALFLNPSLGVRPNQPPRRVAPFKSCKSAKVILTKEPNKHHAFVRFGDKLDQSRALIEMGGMYCRSRPSSNQGGRSSMEYWCRLPECLRPKGICFLESRFRDSHWLP